jgi:hypothetical protein
MKHVSNMGICSNGNGLGLKQVKRGQNWTLKAIYDFDKWPGMKGDDGKWDEVMGIGTFFFFFFFFMMAVLLEIHELT